MIVRILGEGQYDVEGPAVSRLDELDAALEAAVETGDEAAFAPALAELIETVRAGGVVHPAESLAESDLIVPPADATIEQVRALLDEGGLIPG